MKYIIYYNNYTSDIANDYKEACGKLIDKITNAAPKYNLDKDIYNDQWDEIISCIMKERSKNEHNMKWYLPNGHTIEAVAYG